MTTAALIVAAGRGARAGRSGPKQYEHLGGVPVLRRTMRAFKRHPQITRVLCVIHEEDEALFRAACGEDADFVHGGADRQASVKIGLSALSDAAPDLVLIHDGARPLVSQATISAVIEALSDSEAALAALPVADTLKREAEGKAVATVPREGLWRAQTPQGFRFPAILAAHRSAAPGSATDDASLMEALGVPVTLVPDLASNIKLTFPEDFEMAERLLRKETRTGLGFDVHAFETGDAVILGGVAIPHTAKLKGHSDADVAMHALTDALYGAMAEGDIGRHFPPTEEKWRGAASAVFLRHAADLLAAKGGRVTLADVTIVCEAPKIAPHADEMRRTLAHILGCSPSRVSIKATTSEKLGFTGRKEGIAAQAICTIELEAFEEEEQA